MCEPGPNSQGITRISAEKSLTTDQKVGTIEDASDCLRLIEDRGVLAVGYPPTVLAPSPAEQAEWETREKNRVASLAGAYIHEGRHSRNHW